ncbi:DNA replication complex GINS family protein [Candidatus Woesearchaeota archaeon]|nr:DNA replication complex GINS family protein [Candidatus Woesearchaeota archaeon]
MAVQVNLSYETIFDLLVREKGREELQKLHDSFFNDISAYIQSKISLNTDGDEEREKLLKQIQNTRRMLRELYERREKKVLNMALAASRTSPSFIDSENMITGEKALFDSIVERLDNFRKNLLESALSAKLQPQQEPEEAEGRAKAKAQEYQEEQEEGFKPASEFLAETMRHFQASPATESHVHEQPQQKPQLKTVRILKPVPKILSKELEVYGPFTENQKAELPTELADVLINNGGAVEINE